MRERAADRVDPRKGFPMSRNTPRLSCLLLASVSLLSLASLGCATISGNTGLDLAQMPGEAKVADPARCFVVFEPISGRPEVVEVPLVEGATVQTALDDAKADRRFRRMNIHVLRRAAGPGRGPAQLQKMNVEYNTRRDAVVVEYDYALYPNDRIIVKEDPSTIVDDMLKGVAGRMGLPMLKQFAH
jgi:hypothetical protein